jgi:hypothetical protein
VSEGHRAKIEGFSIVLRGSMNPAIHHPAWYRAVGALSEDEAKEALSSEFVFLPQIANFQTKALVVTCQPDRWQVATLPRANQAATLPTANMERTVELAVQVFDKKLPETPMSAIGLNFNHHFGVGGAAREKLAILVASLPLGLDSVDNASAKISYTVSTAAGLLRTDLEPSNKVQDGLYIGFNAHNPIQHGGDEFAHFDISEKIAGMLKEVEPLIQSRIEGILAYFSELEDS